MSLKGQCIGGSVLKELLIAESEWNLRCMNREQSSGHLGNDLTGNWGTIVFPSSSNSLP